MTKTSTPHLSRRAALLLPAAALPFAVGGCSWLTALTDEEKKHIPGNREPVLAPTRGMRVDSIDAVTVPAPETNAEWSQYGRVLSHVGGNFGGGLTRAWSASIGRGGNYRTQITAQPLISGSTVFTMDTDCRVSAFDLGTGRHVWSVKTRPKKDTSSNVGGGIALFDNILYATSGLAEALALNPENGAVLWRTDLPSPARSAPAGTPEGVFLSTQDQQLVGLSLKAGKPLWSYQATPIYTGTINAAAPAYADGTLVCGFESGDLAAVKADGGSLVWTDNLGGVKGTASLSEFASVRGAPVIENGLVFAIGLGGLMASIDVRSGRRVWERDIAGANMPWLAGDILYVVDSDQKLGAIGRDDGTVRWVTDLPRFNNPKRTKGLINWYGPIMVGGKLILVSDWGKMAVLDPTTGALVSSSKIADNASIAPVVAQNTMLVVTIDGSLTAYK